MFLNVLGETCYLYEPEFETLPSNIQELLRELQQEFDEGRKRFNVNLILEHYFNINKSTL